MRRAFLFVVGILVGSALSGAAAQPDDGLKLNHVAINVLADNRAPGFSHIGLEVDDLRSSVPRFRAAGFDVSNPVESARTKAIISQALDKNGVRFELLEFGPGSVQRKAMDGWKHRH